jgi:fructosamine-3-kinase
MHLDNSLPPEAVSILAVMGLAPVTSLARLEGGLISLTHRVWASSRSVICKQGADLPTGLYQREAEGLRALDVPSGPRVPKVLGIGENFIILEDLGSSEPNAGTWPEFGRQLAALHSCQNDQFGFATDNFLGILPMDNKWTADGHEFFARSRILRFLQEPLADRHLSKTDRQAVERIAKKLPDLIPTQPACLCHGDLWSGNIVLSDSGEPAIIDPAAHYGWAEADLAVTFASDGIDRSALDAYLEICPLEPGWHERFELLNIRELLSMIAHTGDEYGTVAQLREVLAKFG